MRWISLDRRGSVVGDGGRAEARRLDVDADGLFVVVEGNERGSSVASRTSATSPSRTIGRPRLRDDELLEVGGRRAGPEPDRPLLEFAFEPADRRREVLRLQRLHDLRDADAGGLQIARPDLHDQLALDAADQVHLATPGMPAAAVMSGSASRVSSAPTGPGRQRQRHDREVGRIELA